MNNIKICVKNVYGQERIYPMSHVTELEILTGQKTLNRSHMTALQSLGFTFALDIAPNIRQLIA